MSRFLARLIPALSCVLAGPLLPAQAFIRGDVNDDGRRSISDAHHLALWLSRSGPAPPCLKAADATDDGQLRRGGSTNNESDVISIFYDSNCDGRQDGNCGINRYTSVAEPRSAPGDDPTPDDLPCDSWTGAAPPVSDPGARMEILEATCPGGENALAVLKVRISHSRAIGGYSGLIDGLGIFADADDRPLDVDGLDWGPVSHAVVRDGVVSFSVLGGSQIEPGWPDPLVRYIWPPVDDLIVLKLYLGLAPGTPAGTYPLILLEGEMADSLTGRAIRPALADGELTVERDVAFDATADLNKEGWQCAARETFPPSGPEDVQVAFRMIVVPAEKGAPVTVPVWIEANVPVEGFSFALTYTTLDGKAPLERIVPVLRDGRSWEVFEYEIDPDWEDVRGQAVFSRSDPTGFLPPGVQHHVLDLEFEVDATAPDGEAHAYFTELYGPQLPGFSSWPTTVLAYGRFLTPEMITCFESIERKGGFVTGASTTEFLRGDANADGAVSLGDAALIGYSTTRATRLFRCDDAGDANDNGGVEYTDAIRIFRHLFEPPSEATAIPAPFPEAGLDGTLDPLPCESYSVVPAPRTDDSIRLGSVEAAPGEPVEVPIVVTASLPLQAYQLVVRFDPLVWAPARDSVGLEGGAFETLFRRSGINHVAVDPVRGHLTAAFAADLLGLSPAPAGTDLVLGKLAGFVLDGVPPGTEVVLEPVLVPEGEPPRPDRLRTEIVEVEDGKLVTRIPALEPGGLRVVDGTEATFHRGDSNFDLRVDLADAVFTLNHLFRGGTAPSCEDAADADDSGKVELTDAVVTLNHLFGAGPGVLAHPHPARGRDAMPDTLAPCREP
jgi:hypothetical protein